MSELNVEVLAVEGQQHHGDSVFPYVLVCRDEHATLQDAAEWVASQRDHLLELANKHGAVLLRDFPVKNAEDFDALVQALSLENFPYEKSLSNAVRINRTAASLLGQRSAAGRADLLSSRDGTDAAVPALDHVQLRDRGRAGRCHADLPIRCVARAPGRKVSRVCRGLRAARAQLHQRDAGCR